MIEQKRIFVFSQQFLSGSRGSDTRFPYVSYCCLRDTLTIFEFLLIFKGLCGAVGSIGIFLVITKPQGTHMCAHRSVELNDRKVCLGRARRRPVTGNRKVNSHQIHHCQDCRIVGFYPINVFI